MLKFLSSTYFARFIYVGNAYRRKLLRPKIYQTKLVQMAKLAEPLIDVSNTSEVQNRKVEKSPIHFLNLVLIAHIITQL